MIYVVATPASLSQESFESDNVFKYFLRAAPCATYCSSQACMLTKAWGTVARMKSNNFVLQEILERS